MTEYFPTDLVDDGDGDDGDYDGKGDDADGREGCCSAWEFIREVTDVRARCSCVIGGWGLRREVLNMLNKLTLCNITLIN